jgi:hypothetical protein
MPQVTIKTGIAGPDGREEELTEYLCDWPGCPNVAEHVLVRVKELEFTTVTLLQRFGPFDATVTNHVKSRR